MRQVFESEAYIGKCSRWLIRTTLLGPMGSTLIGSDCSPVVGGAANRELAATVEVI